MYNCTTVFAVTSVRLSFSLPNATFCWQINHLFSESFCVKEFIILDMSGFRSAKQKKLHWGNFSHHFLASAFCVGAHMLAQLTIMIGKITSNDINDNDNDNWQLWSEKLLLMTSSSHLLIVGTKLQTRWQVYFNFREQIEQRFLKTTNKALTNTWKLEQADGFVLQTKFSLLNHHMIFYTSTLPRSPNPPTSSKWMHPE